MHFYEKISFWASRQSFLMVLTCSWVFWSKNDTERICNYLKKPVLDPKGVKLFQKSPFGVSGGQGFLPKIPPSFTEHLLATLKPGSVEVWLRIQYNTRQFCDVESVEHRWGQCIRIDALWKRGESSGGNPVRPIPQMATFGAISHVSNPKLCFWWNF